jgi:hypothetical protein
LDCGAESALLAKPFISAAKAYAIFLGLQNQSLIAIDKGRASMRSGKRRFDQRFPKTASQINGIAMVSR